MKSSYVAEMEQTLVAIFDLPRARARHIALRLEGLGVLCMWLAAGCSFERASGRHLVATQRPKSSI